MSKWITLPRDRMSRLAKHNGGAIPREHHSGCYALYANGRLVYIGMSRDIPSRLVQHYKKWQMGSTGGYCFDLGKYIMKPWTVKYRPERFYGERATLELRLLRRLKPDLNIHGVRACWSAA